MDIFQIFPAHLTRLGIIYQKHVFARNQLPMLLPAILSQCLRSIRHTPGVEGEEILHDQPFGWPQVVVIELRLLDPAHGIIPGVAHLEALDERSHTDVVVGSRSEFEPSCESLVGSARGEPGGIASEHGSTELVFCRLSFAHLADQFPDRVLGIAEVFVVAERFPEGALPHARARDKAHVIEDAFLPRCLQQRVHVGIGTLGKLGKVDATDVPGSLVAPRTLDPPGGDILHRLHGLGRVPSVDIPVPHGTHEVPCVVGREDRKGPRLPPVEGRLIEAEELVDVVGKVLLYRSHRVDPTGSIRIETVSSQLRDACYLSPSLLGLRRWDGEALRLHLLDQLIREKLTLGRVGPHCLEFERVGDESFLHLSRLDDVVANALVVDPPTVLVDDTVDLLRPHGTSGTNKERVELLVFAVETLEGTGHGTPDVGVALVGRHRLTNDFPCVLCLGSLEQRMSQDLLHDLGVDIAEPRHQLMGGTRSQRACIFPYALAHLRNDFRQTLIHQVPNFVGHGAWDVGDVGVCPLPVEPVLEVLVGNVLLVAHGRAPLATIAPHLTHEGRIEEGFRSTEVGGQAEVLHHSRSRTFLVAGICSLHLLYVAHDGRFEHAEALFELWIGLHKVSREDVIPCLVRQLLLGPLGTRLLLELDVGSILRLEHLRRGHIRKTSEWATGQAVVRPNLLRHSPRLLGEEPLSLEPPHLRWRHADCIFGLLHQGIEIHAERIVHDELELLDRVLGREPVGTLGFHRHLQEVLDVPTGLAYSLSLGCELAGHEPLPETGKFRVDPDVYAKGLACQGACTIHLLRHVDGEVTGTRHTGRQPCGCLLQGMAGTKGTPQPCGCFVHHLGGKSTNRFPGDRVGNGKKGLGGTASGTSAPQGRSDAEVGQRIEGSTEKKPTCGIPNFLQGRVVLWVLVENGTDKITPVGIFRQLRLHGLREQFGDSPNSNALACAKEVEYLPQLRIFPGPLCHGLLLLAVAERAKLLLELIHHLWRRGTVHLCVVE